MQLWAHQEKAVELAKKHTGFALFHEMGTGKTKTSVTLLESIFKKEHEILPTLIIAPLSTLEGWRKELSASSLLGSQFHIMSGSTTPTRVKRACLDKAKGKQIFVFNTDSVSVRLFQRFYREELKPEVLIVDESHLFKTHNSERTKNLSTLSAGIKYRYILTGSPMTRSEQDYWSQINIVAPGKFPTAFHTFKKRFFYDANTSMPKHVHFPDWRIQPEKVEEFHKTIASVSHTVKKDEVLDLPPLVKMTEHVELTPEQKKHYQSLEQDFFTAIEPSDELVTADVVLTKLLRLRQLCCGVLRTDVGTDCLVNTQKTVVLKRLVQEIIASGNKVIIWTPFLATLRPITRLIEEIGERYIMITGGQALDNRKELISAFQRNTNICVATPKAAGTGTDGLQVASYMIYFGLDYNWGEDAQSEARAYRGGSEQHEKVTRIDLITRGTIEEEVQQALNDKLTKVELAEILRAKA